MATSKLSLYNGALLECGERRLVSLADTAAARLYLDEAWDGGAVDFMLGTGQYSWATRTAALVADTNIEPFGYGHAYLKPSDHVRTKAMCTDAQLQCPLLAYITEQNYFFADAEPIYISYVSNDAAYGGDFSLWPADFVQYAHAYLASKIVKKLNQSENDRKTIYALLKQRLRDTKSSDAMEGPTKFLPMGNFVRARLGGGRNRADRGNRNKLIG